MSSPNSHTFSPTKHPQFNFQLALSTLRTNFSNLLQNLSSFQAQLHSTLQNTNTILNSTRPSQLSPFSLKPKKTPLFATISETQMESVDLSTTGMSIEEIEDRLEQVPVYAVSNSEEEFVVASKDVNGQSLALLCFKKEDAETLLEDMKSKNKRLKFGGKVVPVPLNKVFQLKVEGVSFRLVPDYAEVINAVWERKIGSGNLDDGFWGVPVFQEDLEKTLNKTAIEEKKSNKAPKRGDIQVGVLEEIIEGMQDNSTSTWDDVIFVPPGFDASVHEIISS
ncbi:hypothetical protein ACFE04_006136 [Oxalis oulophora]